jgi:acetyl esterase/lipase
MPSPQLRELVAGLREGGPDLAAPPPEARLAFEELLSSIPVAEDLRIEETTLSTVPALRCSAPGAARDGALLYLHGGAFVIGSARGYRALAAELGRAAGLPAYAIDYRLAPEHPFPAAVDDAVAAYNALLEAGFAAERIVIAGDSAGGGLSLSTLVRLRDEGVPLPAAAVLISPWADLALEGATLKSKAAADASLTEEGLQAMASLYLGGAEPKHPLASPLYADLSGLPPLLVQVGSAEILLDDALRIAAKAGGADTHVQLEVWPEAPHVWHAFAFMLPEGRQALAAAGHFVRERLGAGA